MQDDYRICFADTLDPPARRRAVDRARALQSTLTLPAIRSYTRQQRRGALRSNFLDDVFEAFASGFTALGRLTLAFSGEDVVGFVKPPIRLPRGLSRAACRSASARELWDELGPKLDRPGVRIWCAGSLGVTRAHQGRGLARRLAWKSLSQIEHPAILLTGHETENAASRHLHRSLGFRESFRARLLHLAWVVYLVEIEPDGLRFFGREGPADGHRPGPDD